MNNIPRDLLPIVLIHTIDDYKDIRSLRLVCKQWCSVCRARSFWRLLEDITLGRIKWTKAGVMIRSQRSSHTYLSHFRLYLEANQLYFESDDTGEILKRPCDDFRSKSSDIVVGQLYDKFTVYLEEGLSIREIGIDITAIDLSLHSLGVLKLSGGIALWTVTGWMDKFTCRFFDNSGKYLDKIVQRNEDEVFTGIGNQGTF